VEARSGFRLPPPVICLPPPVIPAKAGIQSQRRARSWLWILGRAQDDGLGADGFHQAFEQAPTIGAAVRGFDAAFGVGHHAEYVALVVEQAGDVARGTVDALGIAERDAAFAFEAVERLGVGEIIAVVMRDREGHALAGLVARGEGRLCRLDCQRDVAFNVARVRPKISKGIQTCYCPPSLYDYMYNKKRH